MWAVVGLGNHGKSYAQTRHNAGFDFIRRVAKNWNVKLKKQSFSSKTKWAKKGGVRVLLAMPQTFMNNSGVAVKQIVASGGVATENTVIVYDDLDIPLGDIRVRTEGSAGTHKGMISVVHELKSTRFPRIRIGIGPLPPGMEATEFVLSPFLEEERPLLEKGFDKAQHALDLILDEKIDSAMNMYNQRTPSGVEKRP